MEVDKFVERLSKDFPQFSIKVGKKFMFKYPGLIRYEKPKDKKMSVGFGMQLLHEVGHGLLEHKFFKTDPERLKMERAAWEEARKLCLKYHIIYDEELVEIKMDTYRDWLHKKSKCRECGLTRYQTKDGKYHCPNCSM